MLNKIKAIFTKEKKVNSLGKYKTLSDFMMYASEEEKDERMKKAAHQSNKDQMEVYKKARLLLKTQE